MVTHRTETIKIRNAKTGELHEYHSLNEVPEEFRETIRQAEEAALNGQTGSKITWTDSSGTVHRYNFVDEMPPELRALYDKARGG